MVNPWLGAEYVFLVRITAICRLDFRNALAQGGCCGAVKRAKIQPPAGSLDHFVARRLDLVDCSDSLWIIREPRYAYCRLGPASRRAKLVQMIRLRMYCRLLGSFRCRCGGT